jgi:hypothetical protein
MVPGIVIVIMIIVLVVLFIVLVVLFIVLVLFPVTVVLILVILGVQIELNVLAFIVIHIVVRSCTSTQSKVRSLISFRL